MRPLMILVKTVIMRVKEIANINVLVLSTVFTVYMKQYVCILGLWYEEYITTVLSILKYHDFSLITLLYLEH